MRPWLILSACLLLPQAARAELRLINATGETLSIDVLHEAGAVREHALGAERSITDALGPLVSADDGHMVVVRNSAGKEVLREKLRSNRIHVIKYWGTSTDVTTADVGVYRGTEFDTTKIGLINATGDELEFRHEQADGTVRTAESDPNGSKDVHYTHLYKVAKAPGVELEVEVKGEILGTSKHKLVSGGLYHLKRGEKGLVIERVEKVP